MKANEAPEKIWLGKYTQNLMLSDPNSNTYVEYVRKDTFVEKADKFISSFFHPDDTELKKGILDKFHKYMKGE